MSLITGSYSEYLGYHSSSKSLFQEHIQSASLVLSMSCTRLHRGNDNQTLTMLEWTLSMGAWLLRHIVFPGSVISRDPTGISHASGIYQGSTHWHHELGRAGHHVRNCLEDKTLSVKPRRKSVETEGNPRQFNYMNKSAASVNKRWVLARTTAHPQH